MAGLGVRERGRTGEIFSDHTGVHPTVVTFARLTDDYLHDGRVLFDILTERALWDSLRGDRTTLARLAAACKQNNAPLGKLDLNALTLISTQALKGDYAAYAAIEDKIVDLTKRRNEIAQKMITTRRDDPRARRCRAVMADKALDPADRQSVLCAPDGIEGLAPPFETGPSMQPRASVPPRIKG